MPPTPTQYPYTSQTEIETLLSKYGVQLRADDADYATLIQDAIDFVGGDIDYYCQNKYLASDLSNNQWIHNVATAWACEWFSLRRGNSVPQSLTIMCDRYRDKMELILTGRAIVPGCPRSRRPVTVTGQVVDLRRFNDQIRVDKSRTTGVSKNFIEPIDPTAPDQR